MKEGVYETDMHNIYNLILGQKNEQLPDKVASDATFQAVKTGRDPIGYLLVLKKICLSKQLEQQPIRYLCLATRTPYKNMQYANDNMTKYLVVL